jgi:hypothetical protein
MNEIHGLRAHEREERKRKADTMREVIEGFISSYAFVWFVGLVVALVVLILK